MANGLAVAIAVAAGGGGGGLRVDPPHDAEPEPISSLSVDEDMKIDLVEEISAGEV